MVEEETETEDKTTLLCWPFENSPHNEEINHWSVERKDSKWTGHRKVIRQSKISVGVNRVETLLPYVVFFFFIYQCSLRFHQWMLETRDWNNTMIQKAPGHTARSSFEKNSFFFLPILSFKVERRKNVILSLVHAMISFFVMLKIIGYVSN